MGGWDPGVYVNTGINISKTGSIIINDEFLKTLSPDDQKIFSHIRHIGTEKYPGFPITDPEKGIITPYFFHLYPVWIAIFHSLFGIKFAICVNAVFGLLSVYAVYLTGKTLFNRDTGIVASFLLAINIAQIWQARFPTTEMLAQYLIFSGLYVLALYSKSEGLFFGALSALCFSSVFFARIDAILLIPAIGIFFYLRSFEKWKKQDLIFIVPFGFILGLVILYYLTVARNPASFVIADFSSAKMFFSFVILIISILTAIILYLLRGRLRCRITALLSSLNLRLIITGIIALCGLYAYFLRPVIFDNESASNMVELGWLLSPIMLLVAFAGVVWMTLDDLDDNRIIFYVAALTASVFFIYEMKVMPFYMWAARRFIPIVIPSAVIFAGYFIIRLKKFWGMLGLSVTSLLTASIIISSFLNIKGIFKEREYRGLIDYSQNLSQNFSSTDILVCDGYWLATPLQYIHGLNTLQISDQHTEKAIPKCARAAGLMEEWVKKGEKVFYITHRDEVYLPTLDLIKIKDDHFNSVKMEQSKKHLPRRFESFSPEVKVFKAVPIGAGELKPNNRYTFDIGESAFGLVDGFYRFEKINGQPVRWTGETANVIIPWFDNYEEIILTIRMGGGRPPHIPLAEVGIYIEDILLKNITIENGIKDYVFKIKPEMIDEIAEGRVRLKVASTVWTPKDAGILEDNRILGVQIDKITIEKLKKPST